MIKKIYQNLVANTKEDLEDEDSQLDRITVHIVVVQRSGLNQTIPRSDNIMGSGDGFAQLALMWGKLSFWLVLARCFPAL